jgi:hypothetical protein
MKTQQQLGTIAAVVVLSAQLWAQTSNASPVIPPNTSAPEWSFLFTTIGYVVPHDRSYVSPTLGVDHRRLHLEARYNYENQETGSLWVGYNLGVGHKLVLEATPMLGGVFGNTAGIAPGYRMALSSKRAEFFSEGEYVYDVRNHDGSFFYNWNELTYSPAEWVRTGLVSQRTRAYHTALDVQRGLLLGFSHQRFDFTTYVFNAGWTDPTVVFSLAVKF